MQPVLHCSSHRSLFDERIDLSVSGLEPHTLCVLRVRSTDARGRVWHTHEEFRADEFGCVALDRTEATHGLPGIEPMGLFWSMRSEDATEEDPFFALEGLDSIAVEISLERDGVRCAVLQLERVLRAKDVQCTAVREQGLIGNLYLPEGEGPFVPVLVLGGSEGGLHWSDTAAKLLASRGIAAFSLAYFGIEGLPDALVEVPLEYFETALAYLRAQPKLKENSLGVLGFSKGGELALLLGSMFSSIRAVAAFVPSNVVFQGIPSHHDWMQWTARSSWSYQGKPLAFVPFHTGAWMVRDYLASRVLHRPMALRRSYEEALRDETDRVNEAVIHAERINGPVLLFSSPEDAVWPSEQMCDALIEQMTAFGHAFPHEHRKYKGVGHFFAPPWQPTTFTAIEKDRAVMALGGSPHERAHGWHDAWHSLRWLFSTV